MTERFSKLLHPACIKLSLDCKQKDAAIEEVARLLDGQPGMTDFQGFYNDLLAREKLDTTYYDNAIAMPHGRTAHVTKIMLAVGRCDAGIAYPNSDGKARLLFVLGTPITWPNAYLGVMRSMCRLLRDEQCRAALLTAPTPAAFIAAVVAAEEKFLAATAAEEKGTRPFQPVMPPPPPPDEPSAEKT